MAEFVDSGRWRRNVYDKKSQLTPKTTEQHLIARSDKSVADVTNNKTARRFILLKPTTDRHEASRGLSAIAEPLVYVSIMPDWQAEV